ncbi:hypothetical protein J2847_005966 [Azospirillum agricola]|uniref:hypothetical protein n=1 Tax=Azospirillum agricola TaxID=1720247 RepID=UPI001AE26CAE|nr:hypothetical protein [Azospirillum agricola]MBP2232635.1 hypothetical protein [Azospirillum agricola]
MLKQLVVRGLIGGPSDTCSSSAFATALAYPFASGMAEIASANRDTSVSPWT